MPVDFSRIAANALRNSETLVPWMIQGGQVRGEEFAALNPRRDDRHLGSFLVNLRTGRWADFAMTRVAGGDLISLGAYVWDCSQGQSARRIDDFLSGRGG